MGGRKIPKTRSVLETEVEALRWAILCMLRFNYHNIIFESDYKSVIEAIEEDKWLVIHGVVQDIMNLLSTIGPNKVIG